MHRRRQLLAACVLTATLTSPVVVAQPPELIFLNGHIVTVDEPFSIAQAFAVRGEQITAVGSDDDVLLLKADSTRVIDLRGSTVLPGLIDSHTHPTGASMYEFDHPVPEMDTISDVLNYIRRRAELLDDGDWIVVQQVFITRLRDQRFPTRKELDLVAPRNPVLFRTGPDAAVNSLALEISGIGDDFEITDGEPGYLERDPKTGQLTGILRSCTRLIKTGATGKSPTDDDRTLRLKQLLTAYNAVGITSISDRNAGDAAIAIYQRLLNSGELSCRVFLYYAVNAQQPIEEIQKQIAQAASHPLHDRNERLWLRGVKIFLDGGMLTGSAYMRRPWGVSDIYSITDPDYRGLLYVEPEKLRQIAHAALSHELQMTAHSVGDGAVDALIDAYDHVNQTLPVAELRPCITHCNFMSAEAIDRMAALGIVADLQPAWLYLDGATLTKQFGLERMQYFQPYRSLFDAGVSVGGGSDHMQKIGSLRSVNPYDPWLGLWTVLTRLPRRMDNPLHSEQVISRQEALRLYTVNNAFLTFEEDRKGSLEPGKLADFIIVDRDVLTCSVDELRDTKVLETWLGGRRVYGAEESDPQP
ncbi:MAG: amidohydrolase [Planctomycetaceae bacterium]